MPHFSLGHMMKHSLDSMNMRSEAVSLEGRLCLRCP